jgi:hypothetical protein
VSVPAPPGWYIDPTNAAQYRFWTGQLWSDSVSPRFTENAAPAAPPLPPSPPRPFQSLRGLGTALTVLFIVMATSAGLALVALINQATVIDRITSGRRVSRHDANLADGWVAVALVLELMVGVALAVVVIVWLWRAYTNIDVLGAGPKRYGRGFAIGAWFIPIAAFFMPKQLINDTWRAADPLAPGNPLWTKLPIARISSVWWVLFMVSRVIAFAGLGQSDSTAEELSQTNSAGIVGTIVTVAAAILGAITFRKLTARQQDRAGALGLVMRAGPAPR